MGHDPGPQRIRIFEEVMGVGPEVADALQNLIDRMEVRIAEIREEIVRNRERRL